MVQIKEGYMNMYRHISYKIMFVYKYVCLYIFVHIRYGKNCLLVIVNYSVDLLIRCAGNPKWVIIKFVIIKIFKDSEE